MSYRYLEDIATADAAFEAWGDTPEALFADSADALLNVMVDDIAAIQPEITRGIELSDDSLEMLLLVFLEELVYLKDAEQLLLRPERVQVHEHDGSWHLSARMAGEKIDASRHALSADVKAVTLYRFSVRQTETGWNATVVLDI